MPLWPWLLLAISAVVSYITRPRPSAPPPTQIEDIEIPNTEEGDEIPVVFGTVEIQSPKVVWYGDLRLVAIKAKSGKK